MHRPNTERTDVLGGAAVDGSASHSASALELHDSAASPAEAFDRLLNRHLDSAYRLATVVLGDPTDAEDAAHDAAVLAWRRFDTLRERDRFEQWFCRIVLNVCRDRMRRERRRPVVALPDPADLPLHLPDATAALADRDALERAFARLEPDHRIVIVLRFYRDMQVDAIAALLGVPAGTVKSRLHAALGRLRTELERGERR